MDSLEIINLIVAIASSVGTLGATILSNAGSYSQADEQVSC